MPTLSQYFFDMKLGTCNSSQGTIGITLPGHRGTHDRPVLADPPQSPMFRPITVLHRADTLNCSYTPYADCHSGSMHREGTSWYVVARPWLLLQALTENIISLLP